MTIRTCAIPLLTLVFGLSMQAAEGDGAHATATATATGTVSAVNVEKKSFTLVEDGSQKTEAYRPFYAGGDQGKMAVRIPTLTVGEHVEVAYTIKEGRRALAITDVAAK